MSFKVENALEARCLSENAQGVLHTQTHIPPKESNEIPADVNFLVLYTTNTSKRNKQ